MGGEISYPAYLCRSAAGQAAAIVTFPLCQAFASRAGLRKIGGPTLSATATMWKGCLHEFLSTAVLCWAVFLFKWELPTKKNYLLNQSLVALAIRFNILTFNAAGASFNPALGTAYNIWVDSLK